MVHGTAVVPLRSRSSAQVVELGDDVAVRVHPFPVPLEDCYRALVWLADRPDVDRDRLAIGGASAGDVDPQRQRGGMTSAACRPWIGVGAHDLFQDEDVAYAQRLREAGVPCDLHVVPGAHHGFDSAERRAGVTRAFVEAHLTALEEALNAAG